MRLLRFEFAKILCFVLFVLWIYFLGAVEAKQTVKRGILDNINNGIRYAGQMFGINTAADVASLVAKAFAPSTSTQKQEATSFFPSNDEQQLDRDSESSGTKINPTDMISGLLKIIGFDAGKLGALAINALLMIAQLIGNALMRRQHPFPVTKSVEEGHDFDESQYSYESADGDQQEGRSGRGHFDDSTPLDWILTNPPEGLSHFIKHVTDQELPEKLVGMIEKLEGHDGQGDCIKLLMCKSAPFIWGMQKSVSTRLQEDEIKGSYEKTKAEKSMFTNLPDLDEYRRHGELCERRFSRSCNKSDS